MAYPVLLLPGPVNVSVETQRVMARPPLSPLHAEYQRLQRVLIENLLALYPTNPQQWCCQLFAGSADTAFVAALQRMADTAGEARLGMVIQGAVGERMYRIACDLSIPCELLRLDQRRLTAAVLQAWLQRHPEIRYLAFCEQEFAPCLRNPLAELAACCRKAGVRWILDARYGFGASSIDFDNWPLAALLTGSDTALHGCSGIGILLARAAFGGQSLDAGESISSVIPSQLIESFSVAIRELQLAGGWPARQRRYRRIQQDLERLLNYYGVRPQSPAGSEPPPQAMNDYRLPPPISASRLQSHLLERGFMLLPPAAASDDLISISLLGELDDLQLSRLHETLEDFLEPLTIAFKP
ncbi:MAG: 2-aminoethylphosphonate--pyruvate transaminase [Wenzhouxiangellaceae bacterium]